MSLSIGLYFDHHTIDTSKMALIIMLASASYGKNELIDRYKETNI